MSLKQHFDAQVLKEHIEYEPNLVPQWPESGMWDHFRSVIDYLIFML